MKTKTARINTTWDPVTGCTLDQVTLHPDRLEEPLGWKEPRRIFVCGMGDLFNTDVPDKFIIDCLSAMAEAWWHTFILSTKRPRRMRKIFTHPTIANDVWLQTTRGVDAEPSPWPLPNVWLGVTVENQEQADKRILALVQTPAVARFASVEPMLGPVNLSRWLKETCTNCGGLGRIPNHPHIVAHTCLRCRGNKKVYNPQLKWVICGGETGPETRPMYPVWVRNLRDQCQAAGVPFFFKQWGAWLPAEVTGATFELEKLKDNEVVVQEDSVGRIMKKVGKKAAGRLLDGREWNEYPGGNQHSK